MIGILYCGKELGYISWLLPPPPFTVVVAIVLLN